MGTIYSIIDDDAKKELVLGKGLWLLLPDDLQDFDRVKKAISNEIITRELNWDDASVMDEDFHSKIANKIISFGRSPRLVTDEEVIEIEVSNGFKFDSTFVY